MHVSDKVTFNSWFVLWFFEGSSSMFRIAYVRLGVDNYMSICVEWSTKDELDMKKSYSWHDIKTELEKLYFQAVGYDLDKNEHQIGDISWSTESQAFEDRWNHLWLPADLYNGLQRVLVSSQFNVTKEMGFHIVAVQQGTHGQASNKPCDFVDLLDFRSFYDPEIFDVTDLDQCGEYGDHVRMVLTIKNQEISSDDLLRLLRKLYVVVYTESTQKAMWSTSATPVFLEEDLWTFEWEDSLTVTSADSTRKLTLVTRDPVYTEGFDTLKALQFANFNPTRDRQRVAEPAQHCYLLGLRFSWKPPPK